MSFSLYLWNFQGFYNKNTQLVMKKPKIFLKERQYLLIISFEKKTTDLSSKFSEPQITIPNGTNEN